jgi:hypothetical protein
MGPAFVRGGGVERIWDQAGMVCGTLGERYLYSRKLLPAPKDLRFHPRCPYGPKPHTILLPALLVPIRRGRILVAIQRIFLDRNTARYTHKMMLGRPFDGAWRGGEGEGGTTLAIAEGFEDARAYSILHGVPCWASLGARRLSQLVIPDGVTRLIIAEDNDQEGRGAAITASNQYAKPGRSIDRAPPPLRFKDWAAVLESR